MYDGTGEQGILWKVRDQCNVALQAETATVHWKAFQRVAWHVCMAVARGTITVYGNILDGVG